MSIASFPPEARASERIFRLTSDVLVALMMTCAGATLSSLVSAIFYDWPPALLPGLAAFAAFERLLTHARTRRLMLFSPEWLRAVLGEWVALALIVRVVVGLSRGPAAFAADLFTLTYSILEFFLRPEYLFVLVFTLVVWALTGAFASLLDDMGIDRALIALDAPAAAANEPHPRAQLTALVFSLGSALAALTALVRVNLREIFSAGAQPTFLDLSALSGGGASTLLYFLLGLALLSQSQFITLHTQWSLTRVRINPGVARRWAGYSLVFLALVVGLASLLPTHYSLGFFEALGAVLNFVAAGVAFLGQLLVALVYLLISLLATLFGRTPEQSPPDLPAAPSFEQLPLEPAPAPEANGLAVVRSLLSWGVLMAIVFFGLVTFLRQNSPVWQALAGFPSGRWLMRAWRWLRGVFLVTKEGVVGLMQAGRERLRARREALQEFSGDWINPRRLNPRQRVRFFYLALLRRSAERGLTRGQAQTPLEFADTLERALPDADADIAALTDEFIKARYSRQPVPEEEATLARRLWERVQRVLRSAQK